MEPVQRARLLGLVAPPAFLGTFLLTMVWPGPPALNVAILVAWGVSLAACLLALVLYLRLPPASRQEARAAALLPGLVLALVAIAVAVIVGVGLSLRDLGR